MTVIATQVVISLWAFVGLHLCFFIFNYFNRNTLPKIPEIHLHENKLVFKELYDSSMRISLSLSLSVMNKVAKAHNINPTDAR